MVIHKLPPLNAELNLMIDFSLYNDEKLMQEIKAGNMLAFDELYQKQHH